MNFGSVNCAEKIVSHNVFLQTGIVGTRIDRFCYSLDFLVAGFPEFNRRYIECAVLWFSYDYGLKLTDILNLLAAIQSDES